MSDIFREATEQGLGVTISSDGAITAKSNLTPEEEQRLSDQTTQSNRELVSGLRDLGSADLVGDVTSITQTVGSVADRILRDRFKRLLEKRPVAIRTLIGRIDGWTNGEFSELFAERLAEVFNLETLLATLDELAADVINDPEFQDALAETESMQALSRVLNSVFGIYNSVMPILTQFEPLFPIIEIIVSAASIFMTGGASAPKMSSEAAMLAGRELAKIPALIARPLREILMNRTIEVPQIILGALAPPRSVAGRTGRFGQAEAQAVAALDAFIMEERRIGGSSQNPGWLSRIARTAEDVPRVINPATNAFVQSILSRSSAAQALFSARPNMEAWRDRRDTLPGSSSLLSYVDLTLTMPDIISISERMYDALDTSASFYTDRQFVKLIAQEFKNDGAVINLEKRDYDERATLLKGEGLRKSFRAINHTITLYHTLLEALTGQIRADLTESIPVVDFYRMQQTGTQYLYEFSGVQPSGFNRIKKIDERFTGKEASIARGEAYQMIVSKEPHLINYALGSNPLSEYFYGGSSPFGTSNIDLLVQSRARAEDTLGGNTTTGVPRRFFRSPGLLSGRFTKIVQTSSPFNGTGNPIPEKWEPVDPGIAGIDVGFRYTPNHLLNRGTISQTPLQTATPTYSGKATEWWDEVQTIVDQIKALGDTFPTWNVKPNTAITTTLAREDAFRFTGRRESIVVGFLVRLIRRMRIRLVPRPPLVIRFRFFWRWISLTIWLPPRIVIDVWYEKGRDEPIVRSTPIYQARYHNKLRGVANFSDLLPLWTNAVTPITGGYRLTLQSPIYSQEPIMESDGVTQRVNEDGQPMYQTTLQTPGTGGFESFTSLGLFATTARMTTAIRDIPGTYFTSVVKRPGLFGSLVGRQRALTYLGVMTPRGLLHTADTSAPPSTIIYTDQANSSQWNDDVNARWYVVTDTNLQASVDDPMFFYHGKRLVLAQVEQVAFFPGSFKEVVVNGTTYTSAERLDVVGGDSYVYKLKALNVPAFNLDPQLRERYFPIVLGNIDSTQDPFFDRKLSGEAKASNRRSSFASFANMFITAGFPLPLSGQHLTRGGIALDRHINDLLDVKKLATDYLRDRLAQTVIITQDTPDWRGNVKILPPGQSPTDRSLEQILYPFSRPDIQHVFRQLAGEYEPIALFNALYLFPLPDSGKEGIIIALYNFLRDLRKATYITRENAAYLDSLLGNDGPGWFPTPREFTEPNPEDELNPTEVFIEDLFDVVNEIQRRLEGREPIERLPNENLRGSKDSLYYKRFAILQSRLHKTNGPLAKAAMLEANWEIVRKLKDDENIIFEAHGDQLAVERIPMMEPLKYVAPDDENDVGIFYIQRIIDEVRSKIDDKCLLVCAPCPVKNGCPFYDEDSVLKKYIPPARTIELYVKDNELDLLVYDGSVRDPQLNLIAEDGSRLSAREMQSIHNVYTEIVVDELNDKSIEEVKEEIAERVPGYVVEYGRSEIDNLDWLQGGRYGSLSTIDPRDKSDPFKWRYLYDALFIRDTETRVKYGVTQRRYDVTFRQKHENEILSYEGSVRLKKPIDLKLFDGCSAASEVYLISNDRDPVTNSPIPPIYLNTLGELIYDFDFDEDGTPIEVTAAPDIGGVMITPPVSAQDVAQWTINQYDKYDSARNKYWMETVEKRLSNNPYAKDALVEVPGRPRVPDVVDPLISEEPPLDDILRGKPFVKGYQMFVRKMRIYFESVLWAKSGLKEDIEERKRMLPLMKTKLRLVVIKK